jgi:hypothetical protein
MNGHTPRITVLQTVQALGGLTASLLASAYTLSRWGVTETLCGVAPVLLVLACLFAMLASVVLVAWVGRKWGATGTLRGAAPWLILVGCASMTVAGLAFLAATLQANGWATTVCTVTCLLWLLDFATKRGAWLCKRLRERGRTRAAEGAADRRPVATAVPVAFRAPWRTGGRPGRLDPEDGPVTAGVAAPGDPGRLG